MSPTYPGSRYGDLYEKYPKPANPVDMIGPSLDTRNPRPSYQKAAAGGASVPSAPSAPGPQTVTGTATQQGTLQQQPTGSLSPELAGLMHSMAVPAGTGLTPGTTGTPAPSPAPSPAPAPAPAAPAPAAPAPAGNIPAYLQPLVDAIPGLTAPATIDPGVANVVARNNQMATDIAANQLREKMATGSDGLVRPGESGLADSALAGVYRGGASDTARTLGDMASRLPELNLQRLMAAGNLGQMVSGEDLAREKFGYGKEMDALQMLMEMYAREQAAQESAWAPYYGGFVNAYGG